MAKKRKTRQEKIILQLKRELERQRVKPVLISTKPEPRQEAILSEPKIKPQKLTPEKKSDSSIYFYDPGLVKKDLLKTAILTLIVISLEFVLYLRLK